MSWVQAYRLRLKRRRLLFRALRKRRQIRSLRDNTGWIGARDVLCFVTLRNEMNRLPYFLDHYRALGVRHFLMVDNNSTDGSGDFLAAQADVSLWHTVHSYKLSRFGMDWLTWLQMRYAHGHWCVTCDVDELLVYPHHTTRDLPALCDWLDRCDQPMMGAMMLDMYPATALGAGQHSGDQDPIATLTHFDAGNYQIQHQPKLGNLWIQGGPRMRHFFKSDPRKAPTLNKVPLVKWNRRYVYHSSMHNILPRHLNEIYDTQGGELTSGVLLHTKFLPDIAARSVQEMGRKEHFENSDLYTDYYETLATNPTLMTDHSTAYKNWRQLERLGLMSRGGWV